MSQKIGPFWRGNASRQGRRRTLTARGNPKFTAAQCDRLESRRLLSGNTYIVTTNGDDLGNIAPIQLSPGTFDAVTLRDAITAANAAAVDSNITFDSLAFPSGSLTTITLINGALGLSNASHVETISGPGSGTVQISANHGSGVFTVATGTSAVIAGLSIANGSAFDGAGINNSGTLTLNSDAVQNNTANLFGGGIYNTGSLTINGGGVSESSAGFEGGGIYNAGMLQLTNATISSNSTTNSGGGGIYNFVGAILNAANSTVAGNTSGQDGGGLANSGSATLMGGSVTSNKAAAGAGGGIVNVSPSTLTLTNVSIASNSAAFGGGIECKGTTGQANITITNSTIESNQAAHIGGGIEDSFGSLNVSGSTISGNKALGGSGGGIASDAPNGAGAATIVSSTLSANTASGNGGGLYDTQMATVMNSTISGNSAQNGGGVANAGTALIDDSTISANMANSGGGIDNLNNTLDSMLLNNTIDAGNTVGIVANGPDWSGGAAAATSGNNLIGDGDGTGLANGSNGNQLGTAAALLDPKLAPLANNGGSTQTMALLPGSPAIDKGSNFRVPASITTDQRGLPRIVNGIVDIGAFEVQASAGPMLLSTTIGDGTAQRSEVRSVTFVFNKPVNLAAGAVTLALLNTGGSGANNGSPPTDVSASLSMPTSPDGGATWVVMFKPNTVAADATGSLTDGIYTITLHASLVTDASTAAPMASDQSTTFHRLFGDLTGAKTVNNGDYLKFKQAYLAMLGNPKYNANFDYNADGQINNADFLQFKKRYLKVFSY